MRAQRVLAKQREVQELTAILAEVPPSPCLTPPPTAAGAL